MGQNIELTAADGHRLSAYLAEPTGKPRGGVVVIQEIFGVTRHIRGVADQYAAAGYIAVAPALFDRVERNVEVPYADMQKAMGYMKAAARLQVDAAVAYYGGGIDQHLAERPRVPMMFHFGEKDAHISPAAVEKLKTAYPQGVYFLYPADHGFNCTDRASFEPTSAKLAFERSAEFLRKNVG